MSYTQRGGGFGGRKSGKSFGGDRPWKSDFASSGPRTMHKATCGACGAACEVPFKPNGRKPIFCSNCFKKEGGERPSSFVGQGGRERSEINGNEGLSGQLREINNKLDMILRAMEE